MRISTIETRKERRLVLEGKLITPWTPEVKSACENARQNLKGRAFVVHLSGLTVIDEQAQNLIAGLMSEGVKFRGRGVFAKQVLRQIARKLDARWTQHRDQPNRGTR